jgi:hypothetical protein
MEMGPGWDRIFPIPFSALSLLEDLYSLATRSVLRAPPGRATGGPDAYRARPGRESNFDKPGKW